MGEGLDYFQLTREARGLDTSHCKKTLRLAVLADFATQQLISVLKVLSARRGVRLEVYDGGYDVIDIEILNPESGLYKFEPQFVAILHATEKLKAKFYAATDRPAFSEMVVTHHTELWETIGKRSKAHIIQGNYVVPSERVFGNYEQKVAHSLGRAISTINLGIAEAAQSSRSVLLLDVDHLAAEAGRSAWADARLWAIAKTPCSLPNLPVFARNLLDVILAASGVFAKCLVLDLDNTLWGGVIGDDGLHGIQLGGYDEGEAFVSFQEFLLELKRRGIILSVVSKNNHDAAILPFREHPSMVLKESDISVFIANWDDKATNIRRIQEVLNIGFDSMVFVDDNPFERNLVREFLPSVIVPEMPEDPSLYRGALAALNLFETASFSESDSQRGELYREQAQRELTKSSFSSIEDYLLSLNMIVKLERFSPASLPRIAQLMQRSNQFNLTTRRYSEAACEQFMNDPQNYLPLSFSLADKYGDYGLIGVTVLKLSDEELEIDEFLMSCRVLQRGVEQFVMNSVVSFAARHQMATVRGRYIPTEKNSMVKEFYSNFGFVASPISSDKSFEWTLSVQDYLPRKVFMHTEELDPVFGLTAGTSA